MLKIVIPDTEAFNNATEEFITVKGQTLSLEHSLVSISKWESKWHKPWFPADNAPKTSEEVRDYVRCMTLTQNVRPEVYYLLNEEAYKAINDYIDDPMTATTFTNREQKKGPVRRGQHITSELIYFWMISFDIPFECQKWHLNRLLTLINVCAAKQTPQKKMSKKSVAQQYAALNASRRKQLGTRG